MYMFLNHMEALWGGGEAFKPNTQLYNLYIISKKIPAAIFPQRFRVVKVNTWLPENPGWTKNQHFNKYDFFCPIMISNEKGGGNTSLYFSLGCPLNFFLKSLKYFVRIPGLL